MGFPITVNGITWNSSDFETGEHHDSLGPFLGDCLEEMQGLFNSVSTSSVSIGTGSKVFTVETDRLFSVGQIVRVSTAASGEATLEGAMVGAVTAYNAGTGSLTFTVIHYFGTGTYSNWVVTLGPDYEPLFAIVGSIDGGTGSGTIAGAHTALGVFSHIIGMSPVIEDFIGYFPPVTARNYPISLNGIAVLVSGTAAVYPGGNVLANTKLATGALGELSGDHPGICVLEVTNSLDVAELKLANYPFSNLTESTGLKILFFIPEDNTSSEKVRFSAGFQHNTGAGLYSGPGIHQPTPSSDLLSFDISSIENGDANTVSTVSLEAGYWYELEITTDEADDVISVYQFVDGVRTLLASQTLVTVTFDEESAYTPYVRLTKLSGTQKMSVLIDYIYWDSGSYSR